MGNKCSSPTPLADVISKIRCSYFCCLKGATINVIHTNCDEVDGDEDPEYSLAEGNILSCVRSCLKGDGEKK
jgi:hypothetical protein